MSRLRRLSRVPTTPAASYSLRVLSDTSGGSTTTAFSQTGAETVSVVGASFGGWAAAKAVATDPDQVDRLVLLAASIDDPEKVTGPKLFILAREDFRGGGILRLPEIRDQYERAPEPKTWVVLEGKAHAQFLFETEQGERVMTEILDFLTAP